MQIWLGQQSYERGKYVVAQQKFRKALKDLETAMISDERLAVTLNNLALFYCAQRVSTRMLIRYTSEHCRSIRLPALQTS